MMTLFLSSYESIFATEIEKGVPEHYKCVVKNEKIGDTEVLLERAIDGVNEAPSDITKDIEKNATLSINGVKQKEKPLVTTELLSRYVYNANAVETYAATLISEMNVEGTALKAASNYTNREEKKSSGGEITLATTIYFTVEKINKVGTIKLTKVSATAGANVSGVTVEYAKARYGYRGVNYSTRKMENVTSSWYKSTGTSKKVDVTVNGPRLECVNGGVLYRIWGEGLAHVKRGTSSTWDTTHTVEESGMGWFM